MESPRQVNIFRSPQRFTTLPFAKPEEFRIATEEIFRQRDAGSSVEVLVPPQP
jgi:hypothetical protein